MALSEHGPKNFSIANVSTASSCHATIYLQASAHTQRIDTLHWVFTRTEHRHVVKPSLVDDSCPVCGRHGRLQPWSRL